MSYSFSWLPRTRLQTAKVVTSIKPCRQVLYMQTLVNEHTDDNHHFPVSGSSREIKNIWSSKRFYTFPSEKFHCSLKKSHSGFHFASLISLGRHHFLYQQHSRPLRQQARISSWAKGSTAKLVIQLLPQMWENSISKGRDVSTTEHLPGVHLALCAFLGIAFNRTMQIRQRHESPWNPRMLTQNSSLSSHSYTWGRGKKSLWQLTGKQSTRTCIQGCLTATESKHRIRHSNSTLLQYICSHSSKES